LESNAVKTYQKTLLGIAISSILSAFAGAGAGLCVGILGALVGVMAEGALDTTVISWEMGALVIPVLCMIGGFLVGTLGALSGTWVRGFLIGLVIPGLLSGWWLEGARSFPPGVQIWVVAVWVIAGGAAGAVGGGLRQRLGKNPRAQETLSA
jgi:hypothetical protein